MTDRVFNEAHAARTTSSGLHADHSTRDKPTLQPVPGTAIPVLIGAKARPQPLSSMSPLRYPGSKRKMVPAIQSLIEGAVPRPKLFVEPFCGGASVALRLLEMDVVDHVVLADLDPLVAAFWQTAAFDHEWLIKAMHKEPVTLERWDYWKSTFPTGIRNRALKCLFINRTTFSGIMHGGAGPIGGRAQTSEYTIDCRFEKGPLEARIRNVAALAAEGRILAVWNKPWNTSLEQLHADDSIQFGAQETILYLDPPYIQKADHLYKTQFSEAQHEALANFLTSTVAERWILSYDDDPIVSDLYLGRQGVHAYRPIHHYTTSGSRKRPIPGRELIFTNLTPALHDPKDKTL